MPVTLVYRAVAYGAACLCSNIRTTEQLPALRRRGLGRNCLKQAPPCWQRDGNRPDSGPVAVAPPIPGLRKGVGLCTAATGSFVASGGGGCCQGDIVVKELLSLLVAFVVLCAGMVVVKHLAGVPPVAMRTLAERPVAAATR